MLTGSFWSTLFNWVFVDLKVNKNCTARVHGTCKCLEINKNKENSLLHVFHYSRKFLMKVSMAEVPSSISNIDRSSVTNLKKK